MMRTQAILLWSLSCIHFNLSGPCKRQRVMLMLLYLLYTYSSSDSGQQWPLMIRTQIDLTKQYWWQSKTTWSNFLWPKTTTTWVAPCYCRQEGQAFTAASMPIDGFCCPFGANNSTNGLFLSRGCLNGEKKKNVKKINFCEKLLTYFPTKNVKK